MGFGKNLTTRLKLSTCGITIDRYPKNYMEERNISTEPHLHWLKELSGKYKESDPYLSRILLDVKRNLSIETWRSLDTVRGTTEPGFNYRLEDIADNKWNLKQLGLFNFFLYTPVKPQFL